MGGNTYLVLENVQEVIGLARGLGTPSIVLINGCASNRLLNVCFIALDHSCQRGFFLQWASVNVETHDWSKS